MGRSGGSEGDVRHSERAEAETRCSGTGRAGAEVKRVLFVRSSGREDSASYSEVKTRDLV